MDEEERGKQEYIAYRDEYYKNYLLIDRGRMKRLEFFISVFLLNVLGNFLMKIETPAIEDYMFIPFLILLYVFINFVLKRVRDMGLSPWWALLPIAFAITMGTLRELALSGQRITLPIDDHLMLAVLIGGVVLFFLPLYFWPSQKRDNKYGKYYPYGAYSAYKPAKKQNTPRQKLQKRRAL